jgi:hypothetical protein
MPLEMPLKIFGKKSVELLQAVLLSLGCVVVLGLGHSGCGGAAGAPGTYEISGDIAYEGNPIPAGSINFIPDEKKGNTGPTGIATITDGKYRTAPGRGVQGGAYILQISANDGEPVEGADAGDGATVSAGTPLFAPNSEMTVDIPKGEKIFNIKVPTFGPPGSAALGGAAAPAGPVRND